MFSLAYLLQVDATGIPKYEHSHNSIESDVLRKLGMPA
jgi:hypothetical protein